MTRTRRAPGARSVVVAGGALVLGLAGFGLAARDALVWHGEQASAERDLRAIEAQRRVRGATAPLDATLDAAAHDAIERLSDDGLLVAAALSFGAGAICVGVSAGAALGRARRRQARVALHPSLAAAAGRKLERVLAEHAQDLVTMLDEHGRFTYVSPSIATILGYHPASVVGQPCDAYVDMGPLAHEHPLGAERRAGEPVRHRARHADGSARWLETLSHRIDDDRSIGRVTLYSSRDVTERVQLEEALQAERQLLGETLASVHAGVLSIDADGVVIDANAELCAMVGFRPVAGERAVDVESRYAMLADDGAEVALGQRPLLRALRGEAVRQQPVTIVGPRGARREVTITASPLVDSLGVANGAVVTLHDVSEMRAAEAELRSLATVDVLTGLPNRRHLVAAVADAMERHRSTPDQVALLFIDLDGFKSVNDAHGHDAGDDLLQQVGQRIVSCVRGHDVVARLGGDEFVVLAERLHAPTDVLPLVHRIEHALSEPFHLRRIGAPDATGLAVVEIGGSVGVALASDVSSGDELMANADAAMYARKRDRARRRSEALSAPG